MLTERDLAKDGNHVEGGTHIKVDETKVQTTFLKKTSKQIKSLLGWKERKMSLNVTTIKKAHSDFEGLVCTQSISSHEGAIWAMCFSLDGFFLASGGEDAVIRIWSVGRPPKANDSDDPFESSSGNESNGLDDPVDVVPNAQSSSDTRERHKFKLLFKEPCRFLRGHSGDVVAFSWSKAHFLLSASVDRTVRLWHISR